MAGPSRLGAIIIVTVLSCAVLGAVWGLVIYTLPQSDMLPEPVPVSSPSPLPPPPPSIVSVPPHLSDPPAQTVMGQEDASVVHSETAGPPAAELVRVPLGRDVKCDLEIESLCPEEEGDRQACLERKAAHLSLPCRPMLRERLVRMKANMQHMRAACEADRRQFCRDVPVGGGALLQCLESHAQEVSDQCFQLLPKRGRLLN